MVTDMETDTHHDAIENRLDAMERNIEWLREHDLDEGNFEVAQRLGCLKGDADALVRLVYDD